jgi:hypothetical protein
MNRKCILTLYKNHSNNKCSKVSEVHKSQKNLQVYGKKVYSILKITVELFLIISGDNDVF